MKILIINAYSKSNQNSFQHFEQHIKNIFLNQRELLDTETEFFIRDLSNLDDFLYEPDSIYISLESARLFNFLDMIFIQGESNLRPWSPKLSKLMILLNMCLLTQKSLFASTFSMQALVFLCATNFEKPISIVNGPDGSLIDSIYQQAPSNANSFFLDSVTGDLYSYYASTGQWSPIGNAGLHSNRAAQGYNSIGKYMLKGPIYKPQPRSDQIGRFLQRNYEAFCSVKKLHLQHWLLKQVPLEFLAPLKNSWDTHPFNFVSPLRTFITLAESQKGPVLIALGDNIIGAQFSVEIQYPETLKIFQNFIQTKLKEITNKESTRPNIEKLFELKSHFVDPFAIVRGNNSNKPMRMLGGTEKKKYKEETIKIRPTSAKTFSHVGFSSKKTGTLDIIDNNAIQANNWITGKKEFKDGYFDESISLLTKNLGTSSCENFLKSDYDFKNTIKTKELVQSKVKSRPQTAKIARFDEIELGVPLEECGLGKKAFGQDKNCYEMRKMLHPEINEENLPEPKDLWVPGFFSQTKEKNKGKQRISSATSVGTLVSMKSSIVLKPKYTLAQTLFTSWPKYKDIDLDECRRKPMIRNSAPYMIEQRLQKEKEMKDRALNLGADKFDLGKPKTAFITNYVNLTLSEPPALHHFREEQKKKWVSNRNFLVCKVKNL